MEVARLNNTMSVRSRHGSVPLLLGGNFREAVFAELKPNKSPLKHE